MGLLDNLANAPAGSGISEALMAAASALLTPTSRGGGLGAAFGAIPQAAQQAQMQALRQRMFGLEEKKMGFEMDQARTKQEQAAQAKFMRAQFLQGMGKGGFTPDMIPAGLAAGYKADDLEKLAGSGHWGQEKLAFQNGIGLDPYTGQAKVAVPDVNQPFMPTIGPNGVVGSQANTPFQAFKMSTAKAGAPTTNVTTHVENKMGESMGAQIGPMLSASKTKTAGSLKLAGAAERVIQAVDSGKVFTGPGATLRLRGAQLASVLGLGGKDTAESIAETRKVIRGLAESSLEARKELAGQGQVTENEAAAVQKAMSGDIDDLTGDEIKLIAGLNVKAARLNAKQHQHMLESIPQEMGTVRPFYAIPGMENFTKDEPAAKPSAAPSIDDLLKKYGQ